MSDVATVQIETDTPEKDGWQTENQLCDVCRFHAYYLVLFQSGYLFFCRHHFKQNESELHKVALEIVDESERLLKNPQTAPEQNDSPVSRHPSALGGPSDD